MANPRIAQGTINQIRGSIVVPNNTNLNITAPQLGKGKIAIRFTGQTASLILTATGAVQSPEPYVIVEVTANILKTTGMAQAYRGQTELNTSLGEIRVVTDTSALQDYTFSNCAIVSVGDLPLDGTAVEQRITIQGIYYINSDMWNA